MHEVEQVVEPAAKISCRPTVKFGLHLRYPPTRPQRDRLRPGAALRRRLAGIAASIPSRNRCRPSPCDRLSRPRTTTAAPPHPARSVVDAPIPASGLNAHGLELRPGGSRFHCDSLDEGVARLCPCGLAMSTPTDLPHGLPAGNGKPAQEFPTSPRPTGAHRVLPRSTRFEQASSGGTNEVGSSRTPVHHAHRTRIWQY